MSRCGWRKNEPGSAAPPPERPRLAGSIGRSLQDAGLSDSEIRSLIGVDEIKPSPFLAPRRGLRLVSDRGGR